MKKIIYRRDIDGLRAVAVIPVIFFHAGSSLFSGGFVGVDVFFVISGYLISALIFHDLRAGDFALNEFYERRFRRIIPALTFVILACVPAAWILMPPTDMKDFSESVASVPVFLSNILFWSESGYFDTAAEFKPLLHTWSLSVEEQFYLIFPLMLTWTYRHHQARKWLLLAIALVSFIIAQWQTHHEPAAAFYLLPSRLWELLAGSLAAFLLLDRPSIGSLTIRQLVSALGLTMIVYSELHFDKEMAFPGIAVFLPIIGSVLLILFSGPDVFIGRLLGNRCLVGIGLISYSAYLWHQPILVFGRYWNPSLSPEIYSVLVCISILTLAAFSWRYVERPFRSRALLSAKQVFMLTLFTGIIFIAFGVAGHITNGFVQLRTNDAVRQILSTATKHPMTKNCSTSGWDYRRPQQACVFGTGSKEIVVFGDSHANMLSYPLAEALNPLGFSVRQLSFGGCAPSNENSLATACAAWTQDVMDYLKTRSEAGTVVIVYRLYSHLHGNHINAYPKQPSDIDISNRDIRWQSYLRIIQDLNSFGKRVVVVLQPPEVQRQINDLIFSASDSTLPIVSVPLPWLKDRQKFVHDRQGELLVQNLVIDPTELFCDAQNCYATNGSAAFYFDHNHLSGYGATILATAVKKCMLDHGFLSEYTPRKNGRCKF